MTVPPWVPDQETKPAPMPLLLVQSFVNTWDGDDGSDLLLDPPATRGWLTDGRPVERRPRARTGRAGPRPPRAREHPGHAGGQRRRPPPGSGELHALQAAAQASRPALQVGPGGQVSVGTGPADPLQAGLVDPVAGDSRRTA